jgi:hypothetical protein
MEKDPKSESKEVERDPEEVLRRMLNTPPKPQKDITKGRQTPPKLRRPSSKPSEE